MIMMPSGLSASALTIFFPRLNKKNHKTFNARNLSRNIVLMISCFLSCAVFGFAEGFQTSSIAELKRQEAERTQRKSWVMLRGKLEASARHERYILNDGSGEIAVRIEDDAWRGVIVRPGEEVVIEGKLERKSGSLEIDVKHIQKADSYRPPLIRAADARQMPEHAWVELRGYIIKKVGKETYIFRDASGEIMVEIDGDILRGFSAGPDVMVEIRGEIDWEKSTVYVEAEYAGVL